MCLAIPARVVEVLAGEPRFAVVEVLKVRRTINADLLAQEPLGPGDWVLIHVGFAMCRIGEAAAREQLRVLALLGEDEQALEELRGYRFGPLEAE
jgi:hydrogenase expression/formation protein HypC